ncbi:restriction endonuclease subunit S [Candidatus Poribacteria bacterium]|nr:restriction endonuclease subunit S [Candidatus Poribacteria bacterium]
MNNTIRFGDFVEVNPRVQLEKGKEHPYIEMADINPGNAFVFPQEERVYKGGGSRFQSGDILFARITPCLENGKIVQFKHTGNQPCFGSTEFFIFRGKPNISDSTYILYLALSPIIRDPAVKSMSGASGRQRAALSSVEDISIPFLPLPTQRKIAAILSTYDDLIENNTRRIKILEDMAQTLYREWFVHYRFPGHENVPMVQSELRPIPQGWEVKQLGEMCNILMGLSPKSEFYNETGEGLPFHQGVTDFGSRFPTDRVYCTVQKRIAETDDILFSVRAPVGRINIANKRIVIGRGLSAIRSKSNNQHFILHQLKDRFQEEDTMGSGTIFNAITKADLLGIQLLKPTSAIVAKFEKTVGPISSELATLTIKNANLRQTRDLLLPKLISGEIDVSDLDIDTDDVQPNKGGTHIPYALTERLHSDKKILDGKPVIKGTRLSVTFILGLLKQGWKEEEIIENYPRITQEDIEACHEYQKVTRASISR